MDICTHIYVICTRKVPVLCTNYPLKALWGLTFRGAPPGPPMRQCLLPFCAISCCWAKQWALGLLVV